MPAFLESFVQAWGAGFMSGPTFDELRWDDIRWDDVVARTILSAEFAKVWEAFKGGGIGSIEAGRHCAS